MRQHVTTTPATAMLREAGVSFSEHVFAYVDHGGTAASSAALGLPEHHVVKTLVMQDEKQRPLIVLMHGDRLVSTKNLARQIGAKHIEPCKPEIAERHTGYQVGGTSPFGTRKKFPIYVERTVLALDPVYLNGGRRGYLVGMDASDLVRLLSPTPVEVALAK